MANNLEKFYNQFKGVDSRSNKLLQDPGAFRKGSKNFRYDFQDQIINAQGFQRKDSGAPAFVDIFEYKFRDANTGEAKTQVLGVATDGYLYRKKNHFLRFSAHGAATSVSVFYDETVDSFKVTLTGLGTVTVSDTMVLKDNPTTTASLVGALNALAGVTAIIVDDDGTTVSSSTYLAHLLDCIITDTSFVDNPVYYWEVVPYPDGITTPFPVTVSDNTSSNYEGISSVNLNNCIYMTDGGFPMKYDGKAVYRAGVPGIREQEYAGIFAQFAGLQQSVTTSTAIVPVGLATGDYAYQYRFAFKDFFGGEYYSGATSYWDVITISAANKALETTNIGYKYGKDFPVFACVSVNSSASATAGGTGADGAMIFTTDAVLTSNKNYTNLTVSAGVTVYLNGFTMNYSGALTLSGAVKDSVTSRSGGAVTVTVASGHNVVAGQCLVLKKLSTSNTTTGFRGYFYAKVTAVTSTSVTFTDPSIEHNFVWGDTVVNAYWVPTGIENTLATQDRSAIPFGASLQVFRTQVDQVSSMTVGGPFYAVGCAALPYSNSDTGSVLDDLDDDYLATNIDDLEPGGELPRACKYLSQVQGQLVQCGAPLNYSDKDIEYPSSRQAISSTTAPYAAYPDKLKYTEALMADFQSVYWADYLTPEGFPLDGLHEIAIDTKFSDKIKGVAPNKDALFAFKERSTAVLIGNFAQNDVTIEVLEADCGCISHKTIEEVRGALIWLDGINGFYSCVAGRLPENIGYPIQDYTKINAAGLNFSSASAANFRKESLYVCSVGTTTFVFDYADNGTMRRACWYIWDRINGQSVLATSDDKLLIWDNTRTWKMKLTNTKYDFTDHKSAISMSLLTAWASQGYPTIDKHYVGLWINSIQGDFTLTVKQYGNFLEDQIASQGNISMIAESSSKKFVKQQVKAAIPKLSSISFGIENAEKNKSVKIQGYEIQYSPDFNTGEPKR